MTVGACERYNVSSVVISTDNALASDVAGLGGLGARQAYAPGDRR
jgi:hypothetical protein